MEKETQSNRSHNHEGPKNHIISFVVSIFLTLLAFWAIISKQVSTAFAIPFILCLAVIQVLFQLLYWMHMKEKGHGQPMLFMASGALVAFVTILTFLIWLW